MAMLTINGAAAPSPTELKVQMFDVCAAQTRSASGRLLSDRTAVKRRLTLKWAHLTPSALGALLGAVGDSAFFTATYPDPQTAQTREMTCRCAERTAGILRADGDEPVWTDVEMEWIER